MIAVDTNILIYAHREDSPWHAAAFRCLQVLAEARSFWAIPWPCLVEFYAIVTHPRIYQPPTPTALALEQIDAWLESPSLFLLSETPDMWLEFRSLMLAGKIVGAQVHEARIAALCRAHRISELWTADRDFNRFPGLATRNPLLG